MTPPRSQLANLGRRHASEAAAAHRRADREDLAADADRLLARFPE